MSADCMRISRGVARLADIPDREGGDGGPELVIARAPGRPSWPPCVGGARSGRRRCGVFAADTSWHEDAVGRARMEMHMVIERRSKAVQEGDGAESRASYARPVAVTGRARRGTKQPLDLLAAPASFSRSASRLNARWMRRKFAASAPSTSDW